MENRLLFYSRELGLLLNIYVSVKLLSLGQRREEHVNCLNCISRVKKLRKVRRLSKESPNFVTG